MSASKMQFQQGTEVGVVEEEGTQPIAYAVLGGLSVSLTTLEDGRLYVNIEAVDEGHIEAVVVRDGDTELATIQYDAEPVTPEDAVWYNNAAILFDTPEDVDIDKSEYARGVVEMLEMRVSQTEKEDVARILAGFIRQALQLD